MSANEFNPSLRGFSGSSLGAKMELERENFEAGGKAFEKLRWDSLEILEIEYRKKDIRGNLG